MEKRVAQKKQSTGLTLQDLLLTAVLLAAGAVLKFFVGSIINIGGMKPNFIIAMYCMAIALIRPKIWYSIIIGLLAGAVCQFFPGTPWLNFGSEFAGALCMGLLILIPAKRTVTHTITTAIITWISTVVSGGLYTIMLFVFVKANPSGIVAYVPIVLSTATLNAIIVGVLYLPLMKVLKKPLPLKGAEEENSAEGTAENDKSKKKISKFEIIVIAVVAVLLIVTCVVTLNKTLKAKAVAEQAAVTAAAEQVAADAAAASAEIVDAAVTATEAAE